MGAAGFLVGSSLRAIVAQRLVRRVCEHCANDYKADEQETLWLSHLLGKSLDGINFKHGKGCQSCHYTGYRGRIGVFELLEMNEQMMSALKQDDTEAFTQHAKASPSFRPLALAAFDYATSGITSVEEVLRLVETVDVVRQS
jgi:MSHA biogenesis protein MshE